MRSKYYFLPQRYGLEQHLQFLSHEGCADGGRAVSRKCLLDISDDERSLSDAYVVCQERKTRDVRKQSTKVSTHKS